jgi:hypothetical protein
METHLGSLIQSAIPQLRAVTETDSARRPVPGKWSKKEILGHLIDSASNNHQRFVRLQLEPSIRLPGYEQDGWVRVQSYQEAPWEELIDLWALYNRHLERLIRRLDPACLEHVWEGPYGNVTLRFMADDYVEHMKHHFRQLGVAT